MLEQETAYYKDNLDTLQKNYPEKYVVISGDKIVGAYNSDEQAYAGAIEAKCPLGAFAIKYITGNPEDQIQRFSSLVYV